MILPSTLSHSVVRFVCAAMLLLAFSAPAEDPKSLTTIVITAREGLPDPNFKDAIVVVMNNIGAAPAGVIINKPTKIPVARVFADLQHLDKLDDRIYFGGPVRIEAVSFLFRADTPPENATRVLDDVYFSANPQLLRQLLSREKPMKDLRIFVGYAGWAPGQLEDEIARGDWKLTPADPRSIFEHRSEHPWPEPDVPAGAGRRT